MCKVIIDVKILIEYQTNRACMHKQKRDKNGYYHHLL